MNNIILIGLMGCGKTSLGRATADFLGLNYVDMDEYIEKKVGLTIDEQFAKYGEKYFRDRESEAAADAIQMSNTVISTGGGVILRPENMAALKQSGRIIFLDRPLDQILSDVDISKRPLLKNGPEKLISIYEARIHLYRKYADFILQNDKPEITVIKELIEMTKALMNPKFALIGDPVKHSMAPEVHLAVLQNYLQNPVYERIPVSRKDLPAWLGRVRSEGYSGFNITMPLKLEIGQYLDELVMEADLTGSVNTVVNENGRLIGYSTEALGFFTALRTNGVAYEQKHILILGAGGAAGSLALRAVLDGAERVEILARRPNKAHDLVLAIRAQNRDAAISWGNLDLPTLRTSSARADIVINTTPQGMHGSNEQWPDLSFLSALPKHAVVCDQIYTPRQTAFLAEAQRLGLRWQNGIDTLIYQSLVSDHLFLNRDIDYTAMAEIVRKTIRTLSN